MKNWLLILLASLTLLSCDPVKRHARLVKKFPHVHQQDTIIQRDTVRIEVPKVSVDTVFHESLFPPKNIAKSVSENFSANKVTNLVQCKNMKIKFE